MIALQRSEVCSTSRSDKFKQDGYLVLENFLPASVCAHLKERALQLIDEFNPGEIKTIFSTKNAAHSRQQYFLDSGDKIRFFFEEGAFDQAGELLTEKSLAINKIGHALHVHDPFFYCFSHLHQIAELVQELQVVDPVITQSMYICKQPHIGGVVNCHQDGTYLYVHGQPVIGLWFAMEDATLENGCLWAIPGGHHAPVKSRMLRDQNDLITTEIYDATPWDLTQMIPLEVPRGSLIVIHGRLPHMSKENNSAHSRHAYTLHVMSNNDQFAQDNWLRLPHGLSFPRL